MQAGSNLVRAHVADTAGQLDVASALAQSALPVFQSTCTAQAKSAPPADCDYRSAWAALLLLERRAKSTGVAVTAAAHAQTAFDLAEAAGDARRQARNLGALAVYAQERGERDASVWLMAQARRLVEPLSDPAEQAGVSIVQAQLNTMQGDMKGCLQALEDALAQAVAANATRLQAQILNNLADTYVRMERPADALRVAERALPIMRRYNDVRAERVLIANIGIAKIGVGRIAEGRQDMAKVVELWQQTGETGRQAQTLREFGEALARAGDARDALDLYHRERALSAELMRVNRSVALKDLQARNDAEARQRDIELLGRDNALKTEALANRDLLQRIWWLLATVMALAIVLVAMLYRRVRETNRRLAANHVQLRAQSERDPLTNLANRRHFQSVMATLGAAHRFEGALLLVDIDHFKHVNDTHGHAAGDQVLIEVAKRLNEAVRSDDLVVRWGGEEFLILAPRAAPEQAEQMAARVLAALANASIDVGAAALRITASIGYARFPLPPYGADVPWEQAINLADMALYTAKNQGRNRAVGITSTTASSRERLRDIEADFDQAWRDGRVTLLQTPGPEPRDNLRAA
jgi:diguanylate cyclase (GGDEF)-like protein